MYAFTATNDSDPENNIDQIHAFLDWDEQDVRNGDPLDDPDCPCAVVVVEINSSGGNNDHLDFRNGATNLRDNTDLATFSNLANWNLSTANSALETTPPFTNLQFGTSISLPVELIGFEVEKDRNEVVLEWATAAEINNAGFDIQRSNDGSNWETIGLVNGNGTTHDIQTYDYTDKIPHNGNNYYWLKQMDYDGQYEFSDVRHVVFSNGKEGGMSVYPNPTSDRFTVNITNPNNESTLLKLFDSKGQLLSLQTWVRYAMPTAWEQEFILEHKEIDFVMVQIGDHIETAKIVITNNR
ncbi:MAG: hypothetical protein AAGD05_10455 [Bacteroidota bacterium]